MYMYMYVATHARSLAQAAICYVGSYAIASAVERSHHKSSSQARPANQHTRSSHFPTSDSTHSTHLPTVQWPPRNMQIASTHKSHFCSLPCSFHSSLFMDEVLSACRQLLFRLADLLEDRRRDNQYQEEISFGQYAFACRN